MGINIKQRDMTDCGSACLASIAAHYGLRLPISRIRQLASTGLKGTNILGLVEAANKMGFTAKGVRGTFEALSGIPKPGIAHVTVNSTLHHYLVVLKVTPKFVEVMDPADGRTHRLGHGTFREMWTGVLVLLLPGEGFRAMDGRTSVRKRCWYLIRPHRSVMVQSLFGACIYTVLGLSTSVYVQKIVDNVFTGGNTNLLNLMGTVMVVLLLFQLFIGVFKTLFVIKIGQQIDARLILGYYRHLLTLPQQFFDTMRIGEILSRINDAVKIRVFINDASINMAVNVFIVLFSFALMFTFYWKLALVMLLIIPLYLAVYLVTDRLNRKTERKLMEDSAGLESQLVESIASAGTIKRFGAEDHAGLRTETRFIGLLKSVYRSGLNDLFSGTSSEFISRLFTIILLWTGAGYVLANEITPGELFSFYALAGYLSGPVSGLVGMNKTVRSALIAADRLFEIMDLETEATEESFPLEKKDIGDVVFEEVSFRYGSRANVFENLNMTIPRGKITGIVGESGSGKSTLISLLQNLYPLHAGRIKIGLFNIRYIENSSLRQLVSVVPQRIDLFAGNLVENIALGDYRPDMQKIVRICDQLGMMDFIEDLPNGLGTCLGENGASLSGGQNQRLAIARALYRDPEILILDEATSSLDPGSEACVQLAIRKLADRAGTVIFITHRLAAVRDFDHLFVMEKGRIVEQGTPKGLLEQGGKYSRMVNRQLMGPG